MIYWKNKSNTYLKLSFLLKDLLGIASLPSDIDLSKQDSGRNKPFEIKIKPST